MASSAIATAAIGSVSSYCSQAGLEAKAKQCGLSFSTPNSFKSFSGLKAASSVKLDSESSFLVKESIASLSFVPRAVPTQQSTNQLQPRGSSFKVAILGAAGGIGQPLTLLIKMSPLVSDLHLYDIANVKGVAADISHCNTPSQVFDFTGPSELGNALKGVDVVVIPAGVPRKPGMTRGDLFNINANIVKTLVEAVAENCPDAFITLSATQSTLLSRLPRRF